MKVTKFPKVISKSKKVMILGSFATFHNGHKVLLDVASTFKKRIIVLIMEKPSTLPKKSNEDFASLETRLQQLSNLGIEETIVLEFNDKIRNTNGLDFAKFLQKTYNVDRFVVGSNFNMGKNASFTSKKLKENFPNTTIVKTQKINKHTISTSLLSEMVKLGDVDLVKKYSPFYFSLNVRVKYDNTFKLNNYVKPHAGIYSAWAIVNEVRYWSVCKISFNGDHELFVEDLLVKNTGYDVTIEFVKKIRLIIREEFDEITEIDKKDVVKYLRNHL